MSPRRSRPEASEVPCIDGYPPEHPWFYKLGGKPPYPKAIRNAAIASGYRGYDADTITSLGECAEPKRSNSLRQLRARIERELCQDISAYRDIVRGIYALRRGARTNDDFSATTCPYMAASVKHAHIYNGFARLAYVDEPLNAQGCQLDLLDLL